MSSMNPCLASPICSLLKALYTLVLYLFDHYLEEDIIGHSFSLYFQICISKNIVSLHPERVSPHN